MVQISMSHEDAALLREILVANRVDLVREIAHTDSREFRHLLKNREARLERMLAQIPTAVDATS